MAVSAKTAAAAKKTSTTDVAGRRVAKKGEPEFASYVEKAIPTRIQEFADWLANETGADIDARSVYLGSALRGTFQKSEENQARITARLAEIEQERIDRAANAEKRAADKIANAVARAEKAEARKVAAAEKAAADKAAKAEAAAAKAAAPKAAPAAKKAPAKAPAKATAAKATPATTRRRPARPAASKGGEDF